MKYCSECGDGELYVTETRQHEDNFIRRRRKCPKCGFRIKTMEIPEDDKEEIERLLVILLKKSWK